MIERFYKSIYRIRRVEEELVRLYPSDKIKSPVHLSIGQEAVSVGVCEALQPDDAVFGTYRGHALYLAKGGNLNQMIAELYGKVTGCARGKGGSMHLVDVGAHMMGTSAVVGTTIPVAVGYAYAQRQQKKTTVVAVFFGDGAVDEGAFHESINFAALKKLPVIFVCENNFYAIHSHQKTRQLRNNLCERAESYGVPAQRIDNNNTFKIYEAVKEILPAMRTGKSGPIFLECMTYRWREHVGPGFDFSLGYRSKEECDEWIKNDEMVALGKRLEGATKSQIEKEVEQEIAKAIDFAEKSPFPIYEDLYVDVFKES
ncbi:MAG: Acetoin:2,6-dichlorophenolindophenol oxidoreductase subunit alpha [Elusimicrobia bacterium]|nr:Acetoin:2,6-dichlorophenolindophenol oxidoreductase subunit alpha [Elusimicrobiota bacterium]